MENRTKWVLLNWSVLILGVILVLGLHLLNRREETSINIIKANGIYKIGGITVDTEKNQIHFRAKIFKLAGWVQHLIYLEGYKWLRKESAIISEAKLIDLQRAIALLDWKLRDKLRYKKVENHKLPVSIGWNGKEITGQELVLTEDKLEIGDFMFLGFSYFDQAALKSPVHMDCRFCPLFPLEEKVLREEFKRESGQSGYELNTLLFPPKETEVTVIIRQEGTKK